ncbi:hypothetical protein OQH61_05935 [Helicobacter sp. MIT 21-1697]|uniref:hypothetical protein n=1 Tax=Helicobacter sp. MIT 21-1697 TaxID=2993733 RepID=UPI00224B60C5|nr:hypothetical protein [Helicobacter sp. MIT 21-1697]MCX2717273.1 hypothetical protein [Helicobacter sp. MIT 21-1697]
MELYEKIIVASVMGGYLLFLIYQNRDYFTRSRKDNYLRSGSWVLDDGETIINRGNTHTDKANNTQEDNDKYETIRRIETQDGSKDYIEIRFPKEDKNQNDK